MAPSVASFDWGKGSVLATSQYLVAVGPASKWNGSTILRVHVQDMMAAAESMLNAQAREATGVELGFAVADDWLAAKLADPVLFKQVLCKSTVFYRTPAPIIVYYFPYITCLLYLLFLIKHVRTSG